MRHLYLHGFASGPTAYKAARVAQALAERGVALEIPDLNLPSFEHLTITAMIEEVEARLAAQAVEPTVLWGSSLGGYLAALLASRHPGKVARLVLFAPAIDFPTMYPALMRPAAEAWARGQSVPVRHHASRADLPHASDLAKDCSQWPVRPGVSCPTLVLAARNDNIIPLHTIEEWARSQPRAELHTLEADHSMESAVPEILAYALPFVGLR